MNRIAFYRHIFSLLIFSSSGTIASFIKLPSYGIVFYRTLFGAMLLVFLFLYKKNRFTCLYYKKDCLFLLLSGLCQATEWFLSYESFRYIDIGISTVLTYCGPVIVIALSPIVFKERLTMQKLLAIAIVLTGVVCLNSEISQQNNMRLGLIYAGTSAFCYAGMLIFNKKSKNVVGFENSVIQTCVCATAAALFTFCITGGTYPVPQKMLSQWLLLLIIGLLNTGYACFLYFSTVARLPAQVIAISGYLEPVFTILIAASVLRQMLTFLQSLGCFMIIAGACWCILAKK